MLLLFLLVVGFLIGLKSVLLTQLVLLLFLVLLCAYLLGGNLLNVIISGFMVWIGVMLVVGIAAGDIYYFFRFYESTHQYDIQNLFSWFVRP